MPTAAKKTTTRAYPTDAVYHLADVTDRMHGLLMERADALVGCTENSPEEAELAALTDVIEAYERPRSRRKNSGRQGLAPRTRLPGRKRVCPECGGRDLGSRRQARATAQAHEATGAGLTADEPRSATRRPFAGSSSATKDHLLDRLVPSRYSPGALGEPTCRTTKPVRTIL